jgi:hypothetical protein
MKGLFDTVLDDGFIYERQHLFRAGFGCGQETSAQTSGREDGLSDFGDHVALFYLTNVDDLFHQ